MAISKGIDWGVLVTFLVEKELGVPSYPGDSHLLFFYCEFIHIQDSVESWFATLP